MDIIGIERALLNFSRLAPDAAEKMYPRLSQELLHLHMGCRTRNTPRDARSIYDLLQDLRLEKDEGLVKEARRLLDTRGSLRAVDEGEPK